MLGIAEYSMYGQQSQTSSTHQVSFETKLKKTLRLNRDLKYDWSVPL